MKLFRNKWTALFLSNFLGVYNDNFLKNCIIFIAVGWSLPSWLTQSQLISIVSASLVIPYLFLSPLGGRLAVVYSKIKVFRFFKLLEMPIMLTACFAFYFHLVLLAVFSVFLMGIQSCLYSPSKYSLIRDIGGKEGVSYGSGVFETMAFLGILTGTVTASFLSDIYNQWILFLFFLGLALLGYLVTRSIHALELPEHKTDLSDIRPGRFLMNSYRFAHSHSFLNSAVLGASSFWLIGGMLQMNLIIHCKQVYHASNTTTGLVMASAAIGIALGCSVAGRFSQNEVKRGLILLGLLGMILLLTALTFVPMRMSIFIICVFSVAFMGGIYQVPCLSMVQQANLGRKLGDMIAYLNLVTFSFVLLGTLLFSITTYLFAENSFIVFGVILVVCVSMAGYFLRKSPVFWKETKLILSRTE